MCGWSTDDASGEAVVVCRLVDGSVGEIPARWTDLPWRGVEGSLGVVASPAGWRLLGERLGSLAATRRPVDRAQVGVRHGEGDALRVTGFEGRQHPSQTQMPATAHQAQGSTAHAELAEVEIAFQTPQPRRLFAHVRTRVGAAVDRGVQAFTVQEVVLDELQYASGSVI